MARPKAAEFLPLLTGLPADIPAYRVKLIEGDLRMALAQNEKALACYGEAASGIAAAAADQSIDRQTRQLAKELLK